MVRVRDTGMGIAPEMLPKVFDMFTQLDRTLERKREYLEWARSVVDGLRGTHPRLEALFDEAFRARP